LKQSDREKDGERWRRIAYLLETERRQERGREKWRKAGKMRRRRRRRRMSKRLHKFREGEEVG